MAIGERVQSWADKWEGAEGITREVCDWIKVHSPRPATVYGNIKTHKPSWPYKFIMSAHGTATERLARWVEHHLQPFAQQHTSYIKDTPIFLKHLEYINKTRAPLSDTTKLISWDIVNFYPNCNTKMCIEAIKRVLQTYPDIDPKVPTESIIEALEITMSSNNTKFEGRFFTQSNGATIGGPESASVTDIFGAIFIDPVAKAGDPSFLVTGRDIGMTPRI